MGTRKTDGKMTTDGSKAKMDDSCNMQGTHSGYMLQQLQRTNSTCYPPD